MPIILGQDTSTSTSSHHLSRSRTIPLLILQFISAVYLELWIIVSIFDSAFSSGGSLKGPLSVYAPFPSPLLPLPPICLPNPKSLTETRILIPLSLLTLTLLPTILYQAHHVATETLSPKKYSRFEIGKSVFIAGFIGAMLIARGWLSWGEVGVLTGVVLVFGVSLWDALRLGWEGEGRGYRGVDTGEGGGE
jgi:hypothetical protein